jgi:hypothetical protein
MEEINSATQFLEYFKQHKQGFVCCEPKSNYKLFGEKTLFFFVTDIIEPETIVYKVISVHGKTMFKLSYVDLKSEWIPFNQFQDYNIIALNKKEFKRMWVLAQLETLNEKDKT